MNNHPLMFNNITKEDIKSLISFLNQDSIPILTNSKKVLEFEQLWSEWLGVKYSIFVNSGSSANILTMAIIKYLYGYGEIITTPFGWVSDIAAILHAGLKPIFCDINLSNLSINEKEFEGAITKNTKALLLTHILGYNGLSQKILDICKEKNIILLEDICESIGTTFNNQKVGSFGLISNASTFYSHHFSTIEGGLISTNDEKIYELAKIFRSHGMLRESTSSKLKTKILNQYPDLNQDFVFVAPTYNMRSTEINAVIGINQLKRLDNNNKIRKENLNIFLDNLNSNLYYTNFNREGNSNYAFTLLLNNKDFNLRNKIETTLKENNIEFRRGMSGGGNQLRQPYLKNFQDPMLFTNVEHVHHFGWYIGNYPELEKEKIYFLCNLLNKI